MTYEDLLRSQPIQAQHGNREAAAAYVVEIAALLHHHDPSRLSKAQKTYLYRLYHRWWKRAQGEDVRWNLLGSKPGRPKTRQGRRTSGGDELDPLSRRLIKKYGTPDTDPDVL